MSNNLKRTLNLKDAVSIVAGSMIGSGIFIVSSDIARQTDSSILLMLCWIIAGITTLCGALCYGELASTIPDEGGQYIYLKKIFSEKLAFLETDFGIESHYSIIIDEYIFSIVCNFEPQLMERCQEVYRYERKIHILFSRKDRLFIEVITIESIAIVVL